MTEVWQPQRVETCCGYTAHLGQGAAWECPACRTRYEPPQSAPEAPAGQ